MKTKLQKARDFENKYLKNLNPSDLPAFHVTGGVGWINDPNGFSVYKGEYHLFFQYYPYDTKWGCMHWGHAKTTDFIQWDRLPCALAPDEHYDKDGCFSGSAVEMPDGRHLLMYTGNRNTRRNNGSVVSTQTQCLAVGDGLNYEKYEANPVLDAKDLPEGGSPIDFRDPKIWHEDGKYWAVVGNRSADKSGSILLFESENGFDWKFASVLASCHNQFGKMWECPDFFELDGKHVLLTSPQDMTSMGLEFHPGNSTLCIIGRYDRSIKHLLRDNTQTVDYGTDFYAMQTLKSPDGRRIMIAWMQSWETSGCKYHKLPFFGQMSLPRELSIRDGRLIQNPVREIERFRVNNVSYKGVMITDETNLQGISGRFIDMTVTVRPGNSSRMYRYFKINVAKDGERVTTIRHKPENNTIRVDRSRSGFPHDIVNVRDFPINSKDELKVRIIMDRYSLEVFVNDGEQAASFVIYTHETADSITFSADGAAIIDVENTISRCEKWQTGSMYAPLARCL
ncbi:MAG: glycoside hydrolase family 32 protein [Clostridia bacterium]|nr:glycoside hydrolase family 32 protein [Clostridia bacterium]